MTNAIDTNPSSPALPRWRFRFGLKALFVITTILCVWLGYTMARSRQAAEMVDRHNAVLDAIIKNTVPPPNGTFYRLNPGSQDELNRRLGRTWPGDRFQRRVILSAGTTATVMSQNLVLDISALLKSDTRPNIARNLATHYSNQLHQLGLQRRSTTEGQTGGGDATANVIWTTPKNELTVVIDSYVDADEPAARSSNYSDRFPTTASLVSCRLARWRAAHYCRPIAIRHPIAVRAIKPIAQDRV